jgi:hypothetical protein
MTNKTRIRVARIAAGAVIAAGASFTAAGIASADECDLVVICAGTPSPEPTETAPSELPTEPEPTHAMRKPLPASWTFGCGSASIIVAPFGSTRMSLS